jgi:hypothetical protein
MIGTWKKAALIVGLGLAAACQSEEAKERQSLIDAGVRSCLEGFETSRAAMGTGAEPQRICTCAMEKMVEGKSIEQARELAKQENPTPADLQAIGGCIIEEMQRVGNTQG